MIILAAPAGGGALQRSPPAMRPRQKNGPRSNYLVLVPIWVLHWD
jgi:hypothetical protein